MKELYRINKGCLRFVLFLILVCAPTSAYAANIEAKLADSVGTNAFVVQNKDGNALMNVQSDGSVEIGPSPGARLQVSGGEVAIVRSGNVIQPVGLLIQTRDVGEGRAMSIFTAGNGLDTSLVIESAHSDGQRNVLLVNGMTGNVGIGTGSPQGRLDVNGTIYQRGGQLYADYVFAPDYNLESIEDHADFMWSNKHLSAVPKAKSDENGKEIVDVGALNRGVLEELEKAHVYIEQLNRNLKELKAESEELKARMSALEAGR
ncbi:MAG: hypothetical protein HZB33_13555 [Nitrospirae bacterium]|nr:hypothetical protein [Nitrospirota bacterium]